ncbi:uncharacterized protein LOC107268805 isoform X2 [Cephus cinctus]|uniref:Uncharacterized protein LOC107268805 isoform X2 n=1 Tax=Cephus cinctus TaxID=211228 RepID=A0AAJ7BYE6_CEPCN|nr:uncharacterized protein LOC107268805 isoform X2 [Cephus cinctus]
MHFWIDKPASSYYGFGGRRYPATPLPKARSGQCRRSRHVRSMVTPVHRFQSLEGTGSSAGPSTSLNPSRPHRTTVRNTVDNRYASSRLAVHLIQPSNTHNNVSNIGNNQHSLPYAASNVTNQRLDVSDCDHPELAQCRLRCFIWITFFLGIGIVSAARYYFEHQRNGLELLLFCGLLVILLLSGCFCAILCHRVHNRHHHRQEPHIAEDPISLLTAANTIANEHIRPIPVATQNSPPPYHIAVLIPSPDSPEEAPPPSYDKIIR